MATGDIKRITPKGNGPRLDTEEYITRLAFNLGGRNRHTQNSPILPDVLVHYAELDKGKRLDLLLTPDWSKLPGQLAQDLMKTMGKHVNSNTVLPVEDEHEIAYNQSVVAVRLNFEELLSSVLPLSRWWRKRLLAHSRTNVIDLHENKRLRRVARNQLIAGLHDEFGSVHISERRRNWLVYQDFVWAARVFWVVYNTSSTIRPDEIDNKNNVELMADFALQFIVDGAATKYASQDRKIDKHTFEGASVYSVNRNRDVEPTTLDSLGTIKADAAARTFDVSGKDIRWAIIDTGIDAAHPGFRKYDDNGNRARTPFDPDPNRAAEGFSNTRVKATYDFSNIRSRLSPRQLRRLSAGGLLDWDAILDAPNDDNPIQIPHVDGRYRTPTNPHGTHVAGILGGDWKPEEEDADPLGPPPNRRRLQSHFQGVCPEIELYDLRVFREDGTGDEFAVISALQFVRSLNQKRDVQEVHGVNLSLAMFHEVSNYACGRSPVCEECARLVGNRVVVVAAAGNDGRSIHTTTTGLRREGYRSISITDPGNAESVITVGSTHRQHAHTYGVSYFSSRGPTGDGRLKPDLVAPGEKIYSTVPGDGMATMGGTSQAAPHVSGAAALLMSRYWELIGDPEEIKRILMATAVDLGREPYFQGSGLVDVFHAMTKK